MTTDDSGERLDHASHDAHDDNHLGANHASQTEQNTYATPAPLQDAPPSQQAALSDAAAARDLGDDLDPQLLAMRQRVLSDSARWRASLPPLDGLAAQVSALSAVRRAQMQAQQAQQAPRRPLAASQPQDQTQSTLIAPLIPRMHREERTMMDDATDRLDPTSGARRTTTGQAPRRRAPVGAVRGALAGVAAVIVVALLAGVLITLRGGHGSVGAVAKHATATTPPTVTSTTHPQSAWQPLPTLGVLTSPPVIAPSNPKVVYAVTMSGSLERSANQGASWQTLPNPTVFPSQDTATWEDIFVSPVDANVVYAMASLANNAGAVNCPTPSNFALSGRHAVAGDAESRHAYAGGGATDTQRGFARALSGVVPCETQVISVDGGKNWRILTLPFAGRLGSASANLRSGFSSATYSDPPQVQGSRLYSYADSGYLVSANGYRLATSTDGGLTWRAVDGGLTANGLVVCWYAATPTGSTVFAVASSSCDPFVEGPQSFWRSDDAGANWRQENLPSGVFTTNLTLAATPTPTLYLMAPPNGVAPHTYTLNVTPYNIYTSTDGGQSWRALPTNGIQGNPQRQVDTSQTFVALPDGTLVAPFIDSTTNNGTTPYYSWQPGGAAWKRLPPNTGSPVRLFLTADAASAQTVWLLNSNLGLGVASQTAYQVYTLAVS